nr:DUF4157 domain-containing protein [Fibrobacter sp. UWB4]
MISSYTQKFSTIQKVACSKASSLLDSSSQSESLQRKADMVNAATQRAEVPRPNNTGMPDNLKAGIESLSGFSMDNVRVHYNSSKPATVQALAYTQGTDIHVAPGQEKYLPHEAWHVAQQMAGRVSPTTNINGMAVNDNAALEHEADVMGEKAVQCKVADKPSSFKHVNIFKRSVQCCGGGGAAGESQETNSSNHSSSSEDLYYDVCGLFGSEPENYVDQKTNNAEQKEIERQGTDKTELTEKQECDAITSASKAQSYEEKLTAFKEKHRDSIDALMKIRITVQDLYLNIIFLELNNPNITENDQQIKDFTEKRNISLAEFKEKFKKIETDYNELYRLCPYGRPDEFLQELKKLQKFYSDTDSVNCIIYSEDRMDMKKAAKYFKSLGRLSNPAKGVGEDRIRDNEGRSVQIGRDHVIPYESLRDYVCLMYEEWDSGKEWYPAAVKWFEKALKTYFKNNPGVESLDELVRLKCLAKDKSYNLFLEDCVQKALLWMPGNIFLSWKVYESVSGNELSSENVDRLSDDHKGTAIDSYSFKNFGDRRVAVVSGQSILDKIQAKELEKNVFKNLAEIADGQLFETKPEEWETTNQVVDGKYRSYYNPKRLNGKIRLLIVTLLTTVVVGVLLQFLKKICYK